MEFRGRTDRNTPMVAGLVKSACSLVVFSGDAFASCEIYIFVDPSGIRYVGYKTWPILLDDLGQMELMNILFPMATFPR